MCAVIRKKSLFSRRVALPVEDRWLSVNDLMEYLGISRDTVYDWLSKKGLTGHKVGRLWKFKKAEIDVWGRSTISNSPTRVPHERSVQAPSNRKPRGSK